MTGRYHEDHIFSDREYNYAYKKKRVALLPYAQCTADIAVVETGLECGGQTHVILSPLIYGPGSGFFNKITIQAPVIMRSAIKMG